MSFLDDELAELKKALQSSFLLELTKKDDTGLILSVTSLLDQFLGLALLIRFPIEISTSSYARIFDPNAPLGSFSAKIHLAQALGLVIPKMGGDLTILRKLRNEYAHSILPPPLSDPRLSKRCASLTLKYELPANVLESCKTPLHQKILESVSMLMVYLIIVIQRTMAERKVLQTHSSEIKIEMHSLLAEMGLKTTDI
jgi:hypothetical protein